MTENKRFEYIEATDWVDEHIIDHNTEPRFEHYFLKSVTDKMNVLDDENQKIKEENEQLKQQLLCDRDSVCDICKHEYFIPSGKYFISKCIKGHEECSKEDIKYCEDFELNGDKHACPKKLESTGLKKSAEKRYYALLLEGDIYPEFFDGGNDDILMETEEVEDLLNEYEQLKQGINDLAQKFQDNIEFDKKQGIKEYPIGFVSYIINYFKEGI